MSKENVIVLDAEVVETLPGTLFKVKLENELIINAFVSGKIRINHINILTGDKVKVEISPYDLTKGRIVYRYK